MTARGVHRVASPVRRSVTCSSDRTREGPVATTYLLYSSTISCSWTGVSMTWRAGRLCTSTRI